MSRRDYERMPSIEAFGRQLLGSLDLDPVYVMLHRAQLPPDQLRRWLLAYWCWYDSGSASFLSEFEGEQFFHRMLVAAINDTPSPTGERWQRGHERRHARGKAGERMVSELAAKADPRAGPEGVVQQMVFGDPFMPLRTGPGLALPVAAVMARVQEHHLFGKWISFKVADMVDRVLGVRVLFDNAAVFMFDSPREAALRLWRERSGLPEGARPRDEGATLAAVVAALEREFASYGAPPRGDRPPNVQEVETILCKWGSHLSGHYPLMNDTREIQATLRKWAPHCVTAGKLEATLPEVA